jgi:exopolysaccharide biosynthesis polyprenyl glycosylphosphotransferase
VTVRVLGSRALFKKAFSRQHQRPERSPLLAVLRSSDPDPEGEHALLLPEVLFVRRLSLEHKRAERSNRGFLLVLLDGEQLFRESGSITLRIAGALSSTMREIDVIGWYREEATIGIVYTEIGATEKRSVRRALLERITTGLQNSLALDQASMVRISFYFYPEEQGDSNESGWAEIDLYQDLKREPKSKQVKMLTKKMIDITGSLATLIVLAPLFLMIAAAVKLTSKGPVLFQQRRVGYRGKIFQCLKFRTMVVDSDPTLHREFINEFVRGSAHSFQAGYKHKPVFKIIDDPRVTPLGRILRKTSLDELPQFWNVLKGDMSLVGPRPAITYELDSYKPWHRRRILEVKPGITGLWQVYGRSRTTFDEMVRMDLRYVRAWSLWLDIKILLATPRALFSGNGAY